MGTAAYYLVTGTGFATRDYAWIAGLIPPRAEATLVDVTSASAVLALMGPRAREVLAAAAPRADLSDAAFPFLAVRELAIAGASLWALRVTYVGELGYELHIPTESAAAVYRRLHQVGGALGLIDAGYRAIESLRLEKGYRAWGADIGPDYSPREAGLMFAVKMRSGRDFIGRKALEAAKDRPLTKRLAGFQVDEPGVFLHGRETILRDGQRVGWLASGGHGHTIGAAIGYGYVRNEAGIDEAYLASGRWELEVAAKRVPSRPFLRPPYDPEGRRLRG
ncbi:MAG: aminomethyl transferase family protein [Alphaproteobacteria bacterium]|nr:aminomethyl transferase family protein [Alphaproteobacteria bacterium]